jgi:DNA-binding MarR family transcriptional regulator
MATSEATPTAAARVPLLHYSPTAGMLLVKIGRAVERWYVEELRPSELTPKHVGVLFQVRAQPTSQQALIESVGVDPSKLVGLLNDLEAEGLIVRRRDPTDRRRHIVELSKEGRAHVEAAERAIAAVEERLFAGLDADERADLRRVLARVADTSGILEGCEKLIGPAE